VQLSGAGTTGELARCQVRGGSGAAVAVLHGAQVSLAACQAGRGSGGAGILVAGAGSKLRAEGCKLLGARRACLEVSGGASAETVNCAVSESARFVGLCAMVRMQRRCCARECMQRRCFATVRHAPRCAALPLLRRGVDAVPGYASICLLT
jgi:hypothetical protein